MKNFNSLDAAYKVELNNNLGLSLRFLANGNLAAISYKNLLVNLLEGNFVDASVANIYLRVYDETGISSAPLIGVLSSSKFNANSGQVSWHGNTLGLDYVVSCSLAKDMNLWLWQVKITNHCLRGISYDLIYAQDVGIADVGAVRTNEAYTCQYIDHAILSHPTLGYAVASRQNVAQTIDGAASFPWLLQGGLNKVANYSTDGFQFYGLHYRETNAPQTLVQHNLPSSCLQYEFALTGLQQEKVTLAAAEQAESTFFAYFMPDHAEISSLDDLQYYAKASEFAQSVAKFVPSQNFAATSSILNTTQMLKVNDLDASDLAQFFGSDLRHVEQQDGKVLSFFYSGSSESSKSRHVVLKAKELQVERPHGHVIFSGTDSDFEVHRLSSTIYMSGIFNSQVTLGNTSFNKLLSVPRNHLNVFKFSGQRIFMRDSDGCFAQLGIPSALEIGVNFARWIYKFADELIEVKTWTDAVSHQLNLTIDSKVAHQFLITHNIVAGVNEDDSHPSISYGENKSVLIQADRSELIVTENPQATFYILPHNSSDVAKISDARVLSSVDCAKELPYIVYETNLLTHFGLTLGGELDFANKPAIGPAQFETSVAEFEQAWFKKTRQFSLQHESQFELTKFNDLMFWYTHNAMVHYLVPHGLEQYSGAAWGTRDVCQGPLEFFLATGDYQTTRKILLTIFSHQYQETGGWPQWFMFDEFYRFQQHESHGDVIVWPLKAILDYIECSNDYAILDEEIPFTNFASSDFTDEKYSVRKHLESLLKNIKDNFISGTMLSCYGDGDWDDTLQPANSQLRKSMVSGWTVQLTYQVFVKGAKLLKLGADFKLGCEFGILAKQIHRDYNHYVIQNGVVAGFVLFDDEGTQAEPLLHPTDERTGIQYRLLPMTRGIISELFTYDQALRHYDLIKENLYYSDGVRLMNQPATYAGGVNSIFKRAELASNVGREVGLQYVHAHIRFIEAMAKLGKADEVWHALAQINPILIDDVVKNAAKRQSNCYFSSSDADFATRYEAQEQWGKLKDASVMVRGGWRIYSSGPGIYINQLISNCLGIRLHATKIELDPVICQNMDGLEFSYSYEDHDLQFVYHVEKREFAPKKLTINNHELTEFRRIDNPYRGGGVTIDKAVFMQHLKANEANIIDIYL